MALTNFDKYALLIPFNEADESTTVTDYSPQQKTVTLTGTAKVDNARGSSGLLLAGGSSSAAKIYTHPHLKPVGQDFGIGFYYQRTGTHQQYARLVQMRDGDTSSGVSMFINTDTSQNTLHLAMSSNGSTANILNTTVATLHASNRQHIELDRVGSNYTLYIDGVSTYTFSSSASLYAGDDHWVIGGNTTGTSRSLSAYIDGFQLKVGEALHTAAFTPPGSFMKTISGNVKNDVGVNAARTVRAYPRGWAARGYETTSDGSTGNYSIAVPDADGGFTVIALDDTSGTDYNDLALGRVTPG
jgi:hypothetical protein